VNACYGIDELLPHRGRMSLLDEIVDHGEDWLQSEIVIRRDSTFADALGVPACIGLEYMAQTVAAYSGLRQRRQGGAPRIGFLLGARDYACDAERFEIGERLRVRVVPRTLGDNGLGVFDCELRGRAVRASAVVKVLEADDGDAFGAGMPA